MSWKNKWSNCCTHTSVFQPGLESHFARLRPSHARATLTADPLHQDLLQVRVILAVDLILNLPAQAEGWTFVSHADSLRVGEAERSGGQYSGERDGRARQCGEGDKQRCNEVKWGKKYKKWSPENDLNLSMWSVVVGFSPVSSFLPSWHFTAVCIFMTTYGVYELTYLFRVQIPSSLPFGPKGLFFSQCKH